jgi:glycosyltransferase involved in cell wall biosynthesis
MMCRTYNAMDVLLSPSMGEGFGLPILEAQSCGTPVIVTDFSSMPELCGAGWKVRPSRHWWTPLGSFQVLPDIEDIADKLEEAYQCDKETKAKEAREFAMQYDYDDIVEQYWTPILKQIEEEL